MKKNLISSYNEENDTFVGKIDGKNGYCADYGISEGVYLGVDKLNMPSFILVSRASEVFNIPKNILESSNVKLIIECDEDDLSLVMFIDNSKICSIKSKNNFGIPSINILRDNN